MVPYALRASDRRVEVWAGHQIQFGGERQHGWQAQLVTDLRNSLRAMPLGAWREISGRYLTSSPQRCDVENRLFLNVQEALPKGLLGVRFERGPAMPPAPPEPIHLEAGHLHYYCYQSRGSWVHARPGTPVASWTRLPRTLPDDGTARPWWAAMRSGMREGRVHVRSSLESSQPFGMRLTVHATPSGPRGINSVREAAMDGSIAGLHADRPDKAVAQAFSAKFKIDVERVLELLDVETVPVFDSPALKVRNTWPPSSPPMTAAFSGRYA